MALIKKSEKVFLGEIESIINRGSIYNAEENMRLRELMRIHQKRVRMLEEFKIKNS